MRNKFRYIFVLIVIFYFNNSCRYSDTYSQKIFDEFTEQISLEPLDSFPQFIKKDRDVTYVLYPSGIYAMGYCGLFFKSYLEKNEFDKIILEYDERNIFKSELQDSSNYTMPHYYKYYLDYKFPVPNFEDTIHNIKEGLDVENSLIYGLNKGEGSFFSEKGLEKIHITGRLKIVNYTGTGFSNGVVVDFSSRSIVYWVIVW